MKEACISLLIQLLLSLSLSVAKSCVYNISGDLSETNFPGFSKVNHQSISSSFLLSSCIFAAFCVLKLYILLLSRQSGWNAFKNQTRLSFYRADGIIKSIIWCFFKFVLCLSFHSIIKFIILFVSLRLSGR